MFEKLRAALYKRVEMLPISDEALNVDELEDRLELASATSGVDRWNGHGCVKNFCGVDTCTGNVESSSRQRY